MNDRDLGAKLGHELVGVGPTRVVVTNDWLSDTSTWDGARALLDDQRFTYAFADLRGYGRSRALTGAFSIAEAAADVLTLTEDLGWERFCFVGHSMSSLVALHAAQRHPERVERVVALCPPPPRGLGADPAMVEASRRLALADDAERLRAFEGLFGDRLTAGWRRFKAVRWRATAEPKAAASYVPMFARDGLPDPTARIRVPVLGVTGERDAPWMRRDSVERAWAPLCDKLVVAALDDCGHYPMQELPPRTVALMERFLVAAPIV
jgi:3-oxoadipate enol-lactonase